MDWGWSFDQDPELRLTIKGAFYPGKEEFVTEDVATKREVWYENGYYEQKGWSFDLVLGHVTYEIPISSITTLALSSISNAAYDLLERNRQYNVIT